MSYTALYRKFRPRTFEDVRGQEAVVTTLKNQIKNKRISHAYLFCGTRGTGKTTIAKIFARAVNCENPKDGSPCGECESCKAILSGASMNVIEIDAASNNSVDNVRQIVEEVSYSPAQGSYKVYIIDEVHMLSIGAFNALLKTLEEPPEYVIFILATTEANKLPVTILSRCQRYDFRRISVEDISARIRELTDIEGVKIEDKAVSYIARSSDGAMRDALSLLDQCIAFYLGQELTYDRVLDVLGAVDMEVFGRMFRLLTSDDVSGALKLLDEIVVQGRELSQFISDFTWYLRNLLLLKTADGSEDVIDVSTENLSRLKEEANIAETETIMRYIRIMSELSNSLRYAAQKRILVEIAIIKLMRPQMERNYDSIIDRIARLENDIASGNIVIKGEGSGTSGYAVSEDGKAIADEKKNTEKLEALSKAMPEDIKQIAGAWNRIVADMDEVDASYLSGAYPSIENDDTLVIMTDNFVTAKRYSDSVHLDTLKRLIADITQKEVSLVVRYEGDVSGEGLYPDIRQFVDSQIDFEIDEIDESEADDDEI